MPRGDKSKYTDKQVRKAEHIADGYEERGVSKDEAKSRAWATVNKESGGGNKSGSGRGKKDTKVSNRKGGKIDAAAPGLRLRFLDANGLFRLFDRRDNLKASAFQIDISPAQCQQLTAPDPRCENDDERRVKRAIRSCGKQS